jgi:cytoskeletal protein CcmA (bactofilin family)
MFRKLTDTTSSISRGVTVVGEIFGDGTVRLFGRIKGEVRASTVLIKEGAEVEGDLVAEELTIAGQVKGTIHATRVKLTNTAVVQGDIFHRSLSIDENARFEGLSKREDNAGDLSRSSKSLRSAHAPDGTFALATTPREPAARDVSVTIAKAGPPLSPSSPRDESQEIVAPIDAMDRVQRALNIVAALGGGSRLSDLSLTAPAAEPRGKNGLVSSSPIPSPAAVPSETEPAPIEPDSAN